MKLDTVRSALRVVLGDFHRGGIVQIDPNLIEDVLWFLDLLRKREGYDVEKPDRSTESRRDYRKEYEELLNDFIRKQQTRWDEELYREFNTSWRRKSRGQRTWHEVLGVRPNATIPERKKAYQSLAMRYHPDRPGGSHEKMTELNKAKREAGI